MDTEKKATKLMIQFHYPIGEGDLSDSEASDIESDNTSDIETEIVSF